MTVALAHPVARGDRDRAIPIGLDGIRCLWHTSRVFTRTRGLVQDRGGIGFGLLIAYVLPGFMLLASLALLAPPLQLWLLGNDGSTPSVGGVLYVTAASVLLGQLLNVFRWAILDSIHEWTGIRRPVWDERLLPDRQRAFEMIVEQHYRYYQFYGNTLLALPLCLAAFRCSVFSSLVSVGLIESLFGLIEVVLFLGSRDVLRRYYTRSRLLFLDKGTPHDERQSPEASTEV